MNKPPLHPDLVHLAFSGSGFLCPAEVGALSAILASGRKPKTLAATSGGAIVSAIYAVNQDIETLLSLIRTLNWVKLMDFGTWLHNAWRITTKEGWCDPTPLHNLLLDQTELPGQRLSWQGFSQYAPRYATFADLDIDLKITATDLDTQALKVFSKETTPHVRVADAARASSSIPFVYPPMEIDGHAYVDGGVTRNIPADLLPNDGNEALCIYLAGKRSPTPYNHTLYQQASCVINALLNGQQALDLTSAPWVKFVDVKTGTLDALDASMPNVKREWLIAQGGRAMQGVLN